MSEQIVAGIRLNIEQGREGLFYGTSPDFRGLLVTGKTEDEVVSKAPQAIAESAYVTFANLVATLFGAGPHLDRSHRTDLLDVFQIPEHLR